MRILSKLFRFSALPHSTDLESLTPIFCSVLEGNHTLWATKMWPSARLCVVSRPNTYHTLWAIKMWPGARLCFGFRPNTCRAYTFRGGDATNRRRLFSLCAACPPSLPRSHKSQFPLEFFPKQTHIFHSSLVSPPPPPRGRVRLSPSHSPSSLPLRVSTSRPPLSIGLPRRRRRRSHQIALGEVRGCLCAAGSWGSSLHPTTRAETSRRSLPRAMEPRRRQQQQSILSFLQKQPPSWRDPSGSGKGTPPEKPQRPPTGRSIAGIMERLVRPPHPPPPPPQARYGQTR